MLIILTALTFSFIINEAWCQENIYTWRDQNGVLNITDYPPPAGADLLEISPSHREEAMELLHRRRMLEAKIEKYLREQEEKRQASTERKQKIAAQEEAARLLKEAEEMREGVRGDIEKHRRYDRRAEKLEEKAKEIIRNPGLTDREIEKGDIEEDSPSGY
jgi:hypothetical protein